MTTWNKITKAAGNSYTKVPKATSGQNINISAGMPIGLLLALTYASSSTIRVDGWSRINKAAGNSWTDVAKAT